MVTQPRVQRSFRLSQRTLDLLDAAAAETTESRNALADRLLGEAVRLQRHPLIRFRAGASGQRVAALLDTRLDVHQVPASLEANDRDLEVTAEDLGIEPRLVRAAVDYYADFAVDVDAEAEAARRIERSERQRWERGHQLLR